MKKKELIDLINNGWFYSLCDAEDIIPKEVQCVATDLEIDRHRWYSTCVDVYACEDGYVGICGVNHLYSEMMDYSDCDCHCEASEYEEVTTITYEPKKHSSNNNCNMQKNQKTTLAL